MTGRVDRRSLAGLVGLVLVVSGTSSWWAAHRDRDLGAQVAALAGAGDIRMLSSQTCSICLVARRWMTEHRVAFSECLIERDPQCSADFQATLAPGTPVLLVRGRVLVGFDPATILRVLQPAG